MILLYILIIIAALIILLLMTKAKVRIKSDGDIDLRVGAGPVMVKIYPKNEKKLRLRDFTHKKFLKKMADLEAQKAKKKTKPVKEKKKQSFEEKRNTVTSTVELVLEILSRVEKYTSKLSAKLDRLYLSVGGKDPADVAVKFGVLSSATGLLLELLDTKTTLKVKDPRNISVVCDYFSSDIKFALDVTLKIRILDALKTGVEILMLKLKHDSDNKLNFTNTERQESQNGREQAE